MDLEGQTISVPVQGPSNSVLHVANIVIEDVDVVTRQIIARFVMYNDEACEDS